MSSKSVLLQLSPEQFQDWFQGQKTSRRIRLDEIQEQPLATFVQCAQMLTPSTPKQNGNYLGSFQTVATLEAIVRPKAAPASSDCLSKAAKNSKSVLLQLSPEQFQDWFQGQKTSRRIHLDEIREQPLTTFAQCAQMLTPSTPAPASSGCLSKAAKKSLDLAQSLATTTHQPLPLAHVPSREDYSNAWQLLLHSMNRKKLFTAKLESRSVPQELSSPSQEVEEEEEEVEDIETRARLLFEN